MNTQRNKYKMGKIEGELALWLPFATTIGFIVGFSLYGWGIGQVILTIISFMASLLNAKVLLFGKD